MQENRIFFLLQIENFQLTVLFTELADKAAWTQHNYHKNFDKFWDFKDNAERVNESDLTIEEFIEKFEKPYKPVIIQGVQNDWKANHKWTVEVNVKFMLNKKQEITYVTKLKSCNYVIKKNVFIAETIEEI